MSEMGENLSVSGSNVIREAESHKIYGNREVIPGSDLWTNGLMCGFEFDQAQRKLVHSKLTSKKSGRQIETEAFKTEMRANGVREASYSKLDRNKVLDSQSINESRNNETDSFGDLKESQAHPAAQYHDLKRFDDSHWVPIGWDRISELVQAVQTDASWAADQLELMHDEDSLTVADLAAPYWEHPAGPVWWCHVDASHPSVQNWLSNAQWLHPAISLALRDEGRLISEQMKYLLYEVPVRVAGGLLFELLGQSAGDPYVEEDDIPIVLRSWQAQNYLITALHIKGHVSRVNVLGITEVQELLSAGGYNAPRTVHEVIGQLACRLTRWDDRLFRKFIFGAADEIELKFMQRFF
uniref:Uncharacterized protein MANES_17G065600 n=1 Tax=Rhizophora mucronata TaxID=61149 RepID=A0A2P2KGR7_RHIMU